MTHIRQQIRDEVAARVRVNPGMESKVWVSRVFPVQKSEGIVVYTSLEEAATDLITPPGSMIADSNRFCIVTIEIHSTGVPEKFDARIDDLATLVEESLYDDGTRFLMCKGWEYRGIAWEYSGDGEKAAGVATMEYAFQYRTHGSDPGVPE